MTGAASGNQRSPVPPQFIAAYEALAAWEAGEWDEVRTTALTDFFAPSLNEWDDDLAALFELVGEPATSLVMACAFEDFVSSRFDPGNRNFIDAFLAAAGAGLAPQARHFLAALQNSIMDLYEVIGVEPDGRLLLRDLMREGSDVSVAAATDMLNLDPGDHLACRVLTLDEGSFLSPGLIPMPGELARTIEQQIQQVISRERRALLARKHPPTKEMVVDSVLREASFMIANVWLLGIARDTDGPENNGPEDNEPGRD
jgi:hypothetical protein